MYVIRIMETLYAAHNPQINGIKIDIAENIDNVLINLNTNNIPGKFIIIEFITINCAKDILYKISIDLLGNDIGGNFYDISINFTEQLFESLSRDFPQHLPNASIPYCRDLYKCCLNHDHISHVFYHENVKYELIGLYNAKTDTITNDNISHTSLYDFVNYHYKEIFKYNDYYVSNDKAWRECCIVTNGNRKLLYNIKINRCIF